MEMFDAIAQQFGAHVHAAELIFQIVRENAEQFILVKEEFVPDQRDLVRWGGEQSLGEEFDLPGVPHPQRGEQGVIAVMRADVEDGHARLKQSHKDDKEELTKMIQEGLVEIVGKDRTWITYRYIGPVQTKLPL